MTDMLMQNATVRTLWDRGFQSFLKNWWQWGILALVSGWFLYGDAVGLIAAYRTGGVILNKLFLIPVELIALVWAVWQGMLAWLLNTRGQVRMGRILSVTAPSMGRSFVRYTVADDDGKQRTGVRFLSINDVKLPLEAGAAIPVLYVNQWVHLAFGLSKPSTKPAS